jgi:hypothetical protein
MDALDADRALGNSRDSSFLFRLAPDPDNGAGFATLKIPKNSEGKALAQTQRDNAVRLLEPVPPRQCGLGPSSAHNH